MTDIVEIHVTCPSLEDARELSHVLIDGRFAACVNIGKEVDSRYVWHGSKERHACAAAIREHHPYDTPAIFGFKVDHVDAATAEWVAEVTKA